MPLIHKNLNYPEWAFLESSSHSDTITEGRNILWNGPTGAVIEVFGEDSETFIRSDLQTKQFVYTNSFGIEEIFNFVLVNSPDIEDLDELFESAKKWYFAYLDWEDDNIITDENAGGN